MKRYSVLLLVLSAVCLLAAGELLARGGAVVAVVVVVVADVCAAVAVGRHVAPFGRPFAGGESACPAARVTQHVAAKCAATECTTPQR